MFGAMTFKMSVNPGYDRQAEASIINKSICSCAGNRVTNLKTPGLDVVSYSGLEIRLVTYIYTVSQKNIPDIFDCNLKTNYQILIIFGTNIPDTTCHQMTI